MSAPNALTNLRGRDAGANRQTDAISASTDPVVKAVRATPIMGAAPTPWTTLMVDSAFTSPASAAVDPLSVRKDQMGYVETKGLLGCTAGALAGVVIFTLPSGHRPAKARRFSATLLAATVRLSVQPNGDVVLGGNIAAGDSISIELFFLAEA